MSNLPPGVTQASIDRAYGDSVRYDWPFALTCEHDRFADTIGHALGGDHSLTPADAANVAEHFGRLLEKAQSTFDADEVDDLTSWSTSSGAACTWTCPVCGEQREEEAEREDFLDPDADRD